MDKPLITWSHSAVNLFKQCPHRFYKTRITKEVSDDYSGTAAAWGTAVHKALERRIRMGAEFPADMLFLEPLAQRIDAMPGEKFTEQKLCFNNQYEPVDYYAPDAWVRIILDLLVLHPTGKVAFTIDYKTGKHKDDDHQLALGAAGTFALHPTVDKVISGYYWTQDRRFDTATFTRKFSDRLWGIYLPHVTRMEEAVSFGDWPKKPSGLCAGWCPVTSCNFWKPKKEKYRG